MEHHRRYTYYLHMHIFVFSFRVYIRGPIFYNISRPMRNIKSKKKSKIKNQKYVWDRGPWTIFIHLLGPQVCQWWLSPHYLIMYLDAFTLLIECWLFKRLRIINISTNEKSQVKKNILLYDSGPHVMLMHSGPLGLALPHARLTRAWITIMSKSIRTY